MLTGLSAFGNAGHGWRSPRGLAPRGLRAAGEVRAAWPSTVGPFSPASPRCGTRAQRAGRRYEKKVLKKLEEIFPTLIRNPWYRYQNPEGLWWCQPDALLLFEGMGVIFEVKYSWTLDAWWQLRRLYEPVVRLAHRLESVRLVIVSRNYDPAVPFPEPPSMLETAWDTLDSAVCWKGNGLAVLPWRL